nr:NADH dehydrogenase subunit 6 [Xyrichtys splendens]
MSYMMALLLMGLVGGLIAVASNPSPYFAALGLVLVAGVGCGVVVGHGGAFLSLVLFLIYLGGMLVVFAYSAALAAEPYPENWLSSTVALYVLAYLTGVGLAGGVFLGGWYEMGWVAMNEWGDLAQLRGDMTGVGFMYSLGGWGLVVSAGVLLLTLFVVLELTRGLARGTIRAV